MTGGAEMIGGAERNKIQLVVFDWAGTTVDYGCFAPVNAFEKAFGAFDVYPTMDEIRAPMGLLKIDHIRAMLQMESVRAQWIRAQGGEPGEEDVGEIYRVFEEKLMESLSEYAMPKPGVPEAIHELREMGIKIGSTTGYNDEMMRIVSESAAANGYSPDTCFTPDGTEGFGRPYPYMIFQNMKAFAIQSVKNVVKVGDTLADIREGRNAGVLSLGVIEGSSMLGLTQEEYEALSEEEKRLRREEAERRYREEGADDVLLTLKELPGWIRRYQAG